MSESPNKATSEVEESWESDSEDIDNGVPVSIRARVVGSCTTSFKKVQNLVCDTEGRNQVSMECLRRLTSTWIRKEDIGGHVRLQWYGDEYMDFVDDEFEVVELEEVNLVLGKSACQRVQKTPMRDLEDDSLEFHTMELDYGDRSKSKAEEAKEEAERKRKREESKALAKAAKQQQIEEWAEKSRAAQEQKMRPSSS